jgi:hypothetical protein
VEVDRLLFHKVEVDRLLPRKVEVDRLLSHKAVEVVEVVEVEL